MKRIATTGLLACAFLLGTVACNQKTDSVDQAQETNEQAAEGTAMEERKVDQSEFMTNAASNGMLEVEAGKLAQKSAQNAEVKKFAAMMVKDHTNANSEMKKLAQQKNLTLPDSMSQEHMGDLKELRDKKGAEFDRQYMDLMVSSHEDAVSKFEDASEGLEDAELKSFASTTLTKIREHLEQARKIRDGLGNATGTATGTK
jgi:putative membrane protein